MGKFLRISDECFVKSAPAKNLIFNTRDRPQTPDSSLVQLIKGISLFTLSFATDSPSLLYF